VLNFIVLSVQVLDAKESEVKQHSQSTLRGVVRLVAVHTESHSRICLTKHVAKDMVSQYVAYDCSFSNYWHHSFVVEVSISPSC